MADRIGVAPAALAAGGLLRVDYCDAFAVDAGASQTPEQILRYGIADLSPVLTAFVVRAQELLLGLRLQAPSAERPFGWAVVAETDECVVAAAEGARVRARVVATVAARQVVFTTMLRFDGVRPRVAWRALAPAHRATARYLLDRGARRLADVAGSVPGASRPGGATG